MELSHMNHLRAVLRVGNVQTIALDRRRLIAGRPVGYRKWDIAYG